MGARDGILIPFDRNLAEWMHRSFEGRTEYTLVTVDGRPAVRADSVRSASQIARTVHVDLRETPVVEFAWRVDRPLRPGAERQLDGHDFAARIYLYVEGAANGHEDLILNYVWSSGEPVGSSWGSPYYSGTRVVVATSGTDAHDGWVTVRRNVRDDLQSAFGVTLDMVESIAIMTDTDNSGQSVTAWYGEIRFLPPE